jgi:long-chain acyl-CoA synthetase
MDDEGYFYIVDRKKDIIIVSGFNVYPRIIEEIVIAHPKVKEVACIGIPDERRGEGVKLFIVKEEGVFLDKEEIIDYCKKNLGKYEVPQEIEFVKEIPKTAVGKVLRRVLKDKDK